jgi:hypothetical protein
MQLKTLIRGLFLAVTFVMTGCGETEPGAEVPGDLSSREGFIYYCLPGALAGSSCGNGGTCVYDYPGQYEAPCRPKCSTATLSCPTAQVCCVGYTTNPYCMPATKGCQPLIPVGHD